MRKASTQDGEWLHTAWHWLLVVLLLLAASTAASLPKENRIDLRNCDLNLPGTTLTAPARCGWFDVPENPDAPQGRHIRLRVAVVPAAHRDAQPDPLFLFAGGPGQAASEAYVMLQWALADIRETRDVVLIDQRGTGQSAPLDCDPGEAESLDTVVDTDTIKTALTDCLAELDADPRYYTSTIAMQDYDAVRAALGYSRINLFGMSYGTRTAQVYYRLFPARVRSIVLDGIVPMTLNLGAEHAVMLDRAVATLLQGCQEDSACGERFPVTMDDLRALLQSLREAPRDIAFINPMTGDQVDLKVDADILAVAIRFLSYQAESQATLPLLLHEAIVEGRLQRLAAQAMMIMTSLDEMISQGMELSVMCSEDLPFMPEQLPTGGTLLGGTLVERARVACSVWPRGNVPALFHDPVTGDVPVLLLSGSRDPVTPPVYAQQVAAHFPNSLNLVAQGLGHGVTPQYCMRRVVERFLDNPEPEQVNSDCVDTIQPAPFFNTLLGPAP